MITTPFLNTNIQIITRNELLNNLTKGVLITPNVDHLVKLQKDKEFYDVYQQAEWVICDSKNPISSLQATETSVTGSHTGFQLFYRFL